MRLSLFFFMGPFTICLLSTSCAPKPYETHLKDLTSTAVSEIDHTPKERKIEVVKNLVKKVDDEDESQLSTDDLVDQSVFIVSLDMIGDETPSGENCAKLKDDIKRSFTSRGSDHRMSAPAENSLSILKSLCDKE